MGNWRLEKDLKDFQNFKNMANEQQLNMFDKLYLIEKEEIWKDLSYYVGMPEYKEYITKSFSDFILDVFGFSHRIYIKMRDRLCQLPDHRNFFIKEGWKNTTCFLNKSPSEREELLEARNNGDNRTFQTIHRKMHPRKNKEVYNNKDNWETKYYKVVTENKKLKEQLDKKDKLIFDMKKKLQAFLSVAKEI